jgi:hypothetical protein
MCPVRNVTYVSGRSSRIDDLDTAQCTFLLWSCLQKIPTIPFNSPYVPGTFVPLTRERAPVFSIKVEFAALIAIRFRMANIYDFYSGSRRILQAVSSEPKGSELPTLYAGQPLLMSQGSEVGFAVIATALLLASVLMGLTWVLWFGLK